MPHYPYSASKHQDELGSQSSSSSQPSAAINKKNRLKEMPSHTLVKLHNSSYMYIPLNLVQQANAHQAPAAGPTLHPHGVAAKAHKQMSTLGQPLPGSPSYSLPTTVIQHLLYTVPSSKFKSLNLSHLTTLIFQLTDNTITNYLQIKREKLLVQHKKAISMVHSTLYKPLQVTFKEVSDPHDLIKYILMKHHTNSSSHLSLIATLHTLHQGTKETVEQYLLHTKKLRDELKPHPEWHVVHVGSVQHMTHDTHNTHDTRLAN